jgi:hypothetical protein
MCRAGAAGWSDGIPSAVVGRILAGSGVGASQAPSAGTAIDVASSIRSISCLIGFNEIGAGWFMVGISDL